MKNVIIELFEESGMSIRQFAAEAGLKYSTAHDIIAGKTKLENIGAGAFVRIAHVFGMTADALIGEIDDQKLYLSEDEIELVENYRNSTSAGKAAIDATARAMSEM